ncbi:hypothetical protein QNO00_16610 [Arthrobacter sp. zg-Y1219]|uniref:hypothetical protein n=1 Tax=Arthrobacter sp. zg-Y1219 TaxID=3049067 RepID=UPI0024C3DF26|nr:hypothetical protein [Arthrobacter sp. zg-Y1219]MDK1361877.1 hypothetical protein [Arthrobacter sp. zg-Y1219]
MEPATKPSSSAQGFWKIFLSSMSRKEKVGYSLFALLLLGIFIIMPAGVLATQEWNKNSPTQWRECTVTKAEPSYVSGRRSESYSIHLNTTDCGHAMRRRLVGSTEYCDNCLVDF